jgi:hypothetical protein
MVTRDMNTSLSTSKNVRTLKFAYVLMCLGHVAITVALKTQFLVGMLDKPKSSLDAATPLTKDMMKRRMLTLHFPS